MSYTPHVTGSEAEMKLRYDLDFMSPGILVSPRADPSLRSVPSSQVAVTNRCKVDDHADLTLTGGLNSFTLRGSVATIRALLTDAIAVLDQVQADGITRFKVKEI